MSKTIVEHLVVDSSGFIHHGPIRETGKNIYSCKEVLEEIKDRATSDSLRFLPYELKLLQFDKDDLDFCIDFSKKTGDYRQLSIVDLKLIAATYRLEKQYNGFKNINKEPKQIVVKPLDRPNFKKQSEKLSRAMNATNDDAVEKSEVIESVACMTSDFSIQNCLLQMGLQVLSPIDGLMIKEAKKIALRCHACFKVFHDLEKIKNDFCPHCGNLDTLKRVQYIVEKDGTKRVLVNFKRPIKVKGTNQQLPKPRGGKHANNPLLTADQKIVKDRQQKFVVQQRKLWTEDIQHIF